MAQENRSARRRPDAGEPSPAPEVPEADAAEQRTPAADDDTANGWNEPPPESFDQAAEADVVEQARDVGNDDDERR
ncbi:MULTISPECIES: hypothetical protein [Nocardiopsis]|uniref:Uncharacterized protein n=1 Tax=Nocardiopsis sinuspersici TaxID=501010 RepID=A0A1V3C4C0_9ACTN|nr:MULTISPECIES: hypothetical protein [Nocardiopsis]NYH51784.1 hypothetical protein [Nocardiopsis sinuspersici]OOC55376.1 hypothetical protein NOSIN_17425 [Nocardiopsis sinuspersici]